MATEKPEIIINSKIASPDKAINTGMIMARKEIEYKLEPLGGNKWKVILTRGRVEDLLKVIKSTQSIEIARDSKIPEDMEIDVDTSDL
jgi:uncharacterized protein YabE (DUF348 family)